MESNKLINAVRDALATGYLLAYFMPVPLWICGLLGGMIVYVVYYQIPKNGDKQQGNTPTTGTGQNKGSSK